jgi:hypothetical protein
MFLQTSVETQWTARRHIPEDDTLHNHRCENLKSYKVGLVPTLLVSNCSGNERFYSIVLKFSRRLKLIESSRAIIHHQLVKDCSL